MPDAEVAKEALSLMDQIPLLGIFVVAVGVMLWIQRYWQAKETADWREWASGERAAFEAALDRVVSSHKDDVKMLGDGVKDALNALRETIRDSRGGQG